MLYGIVCLLCLRSKWVKSHFKIKLNYIYFLKWWQHSYADSHMRLTRHSSDSTAFEAPVNSSQHGVSVAGQLVIRFWAVTSWPCDELTGTQMKAPKLLLNQVSRGQRALYFVWQLVLCDTWNWNDDNDTGSGITILDTTAIPEMRSAISLSFRIHQPQQT